MLSLDIPQYYSIQANVVHKKFKLLVVDLLIPNIPNTFLTVYKHVS